MVSQLLAGTYTGLSLAGVSKYWEWVRDEPELWGFVGLLFFVAAFFFFGRLQLQGIREGLKEMGICRVVPYFEQPLRAIGKDPFERGIELARQCRRLDELAANSGVRLISDFGFRDDLDHQKLHWHEAIDGVRTVEKLLGEIRKEGSADLVEDLARVEASLRYAAAKSIRFCFIVRGGFDKWISGREMHIRKGSFW